MRAGLHNHCVTQPNSHTTIGVSRRGAPARVALLYAAPLAIVWAVGALVFWVYRDRLNSDGVAYATIARRYAALRLDEALNGYWSPLLSWILAPFAALGGEPVHVVRALCVVLGTIATVAIVRLGRAGASGPWGAVGLMCLAPPIGW